MHLLFQSAMMMMRKKTLFNEGEGENTEDLSVSKGILDSFF